MPTTHKKKETPMPLPQESLPPPPTLRYFTPGELAHNEAVKLTLLTLTKGQERVNGMPLFMPHEGLLAQMRSAWLRGDNEQFLTHLHTYFEQVCHRLPQVILEEQIQETLAALRVLMEQEYAVGQVGKYLLGVANRP